MDQCLNSRPRYHHLKISSCIISCVVWQLLFYLCDIFGNFTHRQIQTKNSNFPKYRLLEANTKVNTVFCFLDGIVYLWMTYLRSHNYTSRPQYYVETTATCFVNYSPQTLSHLIFRSSWLEACSQQRDPW